VTFLEDEEAVLASLPSVLNAARQGASADAEVDHIDLLLLQLLLPFAAASIVSAMEARAAVKWPLVGVECNQGSRRTKGARYLAKMA